jgi:O-methyltransferase
MLKSALRGLARQFGYEIRRVSTGPATGGAVPVHEGLYRPLYSPWFGEGEFRRLFEIAQPRTLVSPDRCYVLQTLLKQAFHLDGDVWECGVYKGGTAAMMAAMIQEQCPSKRLYLFDTFEGMPETDPDKDWHKRGDFADTSLESVLEFVGRPEVCVFRQGFIPATFAGLESNRIAMAHIDVDIYRSILDSLDFIWPRLSPGGFVVFDDYGFPSCPGALQAVDEFFARKPCEPLCLPTGQAVVFKSGA